MYGSYYGPTIISFKSVPSEFQIRQSRDSSQYHPGGLEEGNKLTLLGLLMRRVSLTRSHHVTSIKRTLRPPNNGEKEEAKVVCSCNMINWPCKSHGTGNRGRANTLGRQRTK